MQTIQSRLDNNAAVTFQHTNTGGSYYDRSRQKVFLDYNEDNKMGFNHLDTKAHEVSHTLGSIGHTDMVLTGDTLLNQNEIQSIDKGNKLLNAKNPSAQQQHDQMAGEVKADMDVLRYHLKKDNVYDTGTQDFTPKHLQEAKKRYGSNPIIKRLFDRYDDGNLIRLMNTIASNNPANTNDV